MALENSSTLATSIVRLSTILCLIVSMMTISTTKSDSDSDSDSDSEIGSTTAFTAFTYKSRRRFEIKMPPRHPERSKVERVSRSRSRSQSQSQPQPQPQTSDPIPRNELEKIALEAANHWKIDAGRFFRMIYNESRWNPNAVNRTGCGGWKCYGLTQQHGRYWRDRATKAGFPGASPLEPRANLFVGAMLVAKGGWHHYEGDAG